MAKLPSCREIRWVTSLSEEILWMTDVSDLLGKKQQSYCAY